MLNKIHYRRPLVIGTGGGNDIVSACLIVANLRDNEINADVAGVCSPGAVHTYGFSEEMPINAVTSGSRRYIHSKNVINISFVDSKIPELLGKEGAFIEYYRRPGGETLYCALINADGEQRKYYRGSRRSITYSFIFIQDR